MITAAHIPSPRIKRVSGSLIDLVKTKQGFVHLTIRKLSSQESYHKVFPKNPPDRHQKQNHGRQFNEWCMPEPATGYIKASKHNLL